MTAFPDLGATKIAYWREGLISVCGDAERVDVCHTVSVMDDDPLLQPVIDFTGMFGLEPRFGGITKEAFWIDGEARRLVYVPPEVAHLEQATVSTISTRFQELFTTWEELSAMANLCRWALRPRGVKRWDTA